MFNFADLYESETFLSQLHRASYLSIGIFCLLLSFLLQLLRTEILYGFPAVFSTHICLHIPLTDVFSRVTFFTPTCCPEQAIV